MLRWMSFVSLVAVISCDAVREAFSADASVAAQVESERLLADELGLLLGHADPQQVPVTPQTARVLANLWIDLTLLALASADGDSLTDSATVAAAAWPELEQALVDRFHNRLVEQRVRRVDSAVVDSAYRRGDLRLIDHILVQATDGRASEAQGTQRREIEQLQRRLERGADFGDLAAEHSDDPSSERRGRLGVLARGETVDRFEDAAWALAPGATSEIVETEHGLHLIRRPPLDEVRAEFEQGLVGRLVARVDSVYLDSLSTARRIEVKGNAGPVIRESLVRLQELSGSGRTLASYEGGEFTLGDFVQWIAAFDRRVLSRLAAAPDSVIADFVSDLVQGKIVLEEAQSSDLGLTPDDWDRIGRLYASKLGFVRRAVGLDPTALAEAGSTPEARRRVAMERVRDYLRGVLSSQRQLAEVPPHLALALRERRDARLRPAGIDAAIVRAQEIRASLDVESAQPGAAPGLPAPRRPDTGGARPPGGS